MKTRTSLYRALALGLVVGLLGGVTNPVAADRSEAKAELPLEDLRTFAEVFGRIKKDYVEEVSDEALIEGAIRGMLASLDPHSAYLNREEYRDLQVGTSGEFGGLGIEVGVESGLIKVIAPIDDTPAARAGLLAGDLIVRIDDKPVKGLGLSEAVKLMRGKPGTRITLTVVREGGDAPLTFEIERAVIQVDSVRSRTLEPGFGYIRITHFQARTPEDLTKAVATLKEENDGKLDGLILDLRNNPGGVLNSAVSVSDAFLNDGLIVYTQGRLDESQLQFKAGPEELLAGAPLVVLVNAGSASASEIVAGALQDHKRAIIMGVKTFGKGSVQTVVPIDDIRALKLTTARYFTPLGRSIQAQGIVPDIEVAPGELTVDGDPSAHAITEANLIRHLDNGQTNDEDPGSGDEEPSQPLAVKDFALNEALNVLKGLVIFNTKKAG